MSSLLKRLGNKKSYKLKRHPKHKAMFGPLAAGFKKYSGNRYPKSYAPTTELKVFDIALASSTFATPAAPPIGLSLFQPILGTDIFHRIGRKISLKSLDIQLRIALGASLTGTVIPYNVLRFTVVYDMQPNGAVPNYTDVYQDMPGGTVSIDSARNLNNRDRFKVLLSESVTVGTVSGSSQETTARPEDLNFHRHIPLNDMEAIFTSNDGGDVADLATGSIILFASSLNVTTGATAFSYACRTRYQDV